MTNDLSDLEGTWAVWNLSNSHTSGNIADINYHMFHVNWKAYIACNFNGLVNYKSGNISDMVQDSGIVTQMTNMKCQLNRAISDELE